jgi:glycosyltransferase involved in cell wall biosynthesis
MSRLSVTAVIPVFNAEKWIAEALHSILIQTYPADQILVIDDASTDHSAAIARRLGATVISLEKNSGEAHARNVGIKHACCDCIAMLDADDYWDARHLEVLVALLNQYPEASVACSATQRFGLRSELITGYVVPGEPRSVLNEAFDDWLHTTIGAMFRREALLQIGGFSEERRFSVDFDMWLRLSRSHLFVSTHEVTSFWRWHPDQQSRNYPEQLLTVYYFRLKFLKGCSSGGNVDGPDAHRLARRCIHLWVRDCRECRSAPTLGMPQALLKASLYLRPASVADVVLILKGLGALCRASRLQRS